VRSRAQLHRPDAAIAAQHLTAAGNGRGCFRPGILHAERGAVINPKAVIKPLEPALQDHRRLIGNIAAHIADNTAPD